MSEKIDAHMLPPRLPANLGALADESAKKFPDQTAWRFIDTDVAVTFAELSSYTNRAANLFYQLGVRHGTHVAMMSSNSLAYCGGWLALAKLGAVVISVNTRYTAPELHYVLADAQAQFLFIEECFLPIFEGIEEVSEQLSKENVFVVDEQGREWQTRVAAHSPEFYSPRQVSLDDMVNIQYTSGTTGFPKGCMLTHRFWMLTSKLLADDLPFALRNAIYNQNFFYMDGAFLTCVCLHAGAAFHFVSRPSISRFLDWVRRYDIQYCFFFEALYKTPEGVRDAENPLEFVHTFGFNRANHADLERRYALSAREAFGMTECGGARTMQTRWWVLVRAVCPCVAARR